MFMNTFCLVDIILISQIFKLLLRKMTTFTYQTNKIIKYPKCLMYITIIQPLNNKSIN